MIAKHESSISRVSHATPRQATALDNPAKLAAASALKMVWVITWYVIGIPESDRAAL